MSNRNAANNSAMAFIVIIVCIIIAVFGIYLVSSNSISSKTKECETSGKIYDESSKKCREKTISERFNEKCLSGVTIGDKSYTCTDLKKAGLENAYLNNKIVQHGGSLYEAGTSREIEAGKNSGDYCLNASDTWSHIGETRCVVFSYTYMSCSNGYCFLDEKQNYNTGFVAFFGRYNMFSWDSFRSTYYNKGPILVCGKIYTYNGHPEIKITDINKQTILSPQATSSGGVSVYRYSCS